MINNTFHPCVNLIKDDIKNAIMHPYKHSIDL